MKKSVKNPILASMAFAALALPLAAFAADDALQQKVDALTKEVETLKQQPGKFDWLTIGGDYRFRVDSLHATIADYYQFTGDPLAPAAMKEEDVKNDTLYTNRLGLNIKAKVTQDVNLTTRLLMYKSFGNSDASATSGTFFADRVGQFDGTQGHTPGDDKLLVDQAFITWSNIADEPIWFSVGRRPSTGGVPSHLRQNADKPGNGGIPSLMVDYAFDGMSLGYAPDIEALPGAYGKICYGRGFESGYEKDSDAGALNDMDMLGISLVPYETDPLYLNVQWNRGYDIIDAPVIADSAFGPMSPSVNLGSIDWFGVTTLSTLKNVGPGSLNFFVSGAASVTHPNDNLSGGMAGLMYNAGEEAESKYGWGAYAGARYDITSTRTKIGAEYNHGSKNWVAMDHASDDMWTGKLGARGDVYEVYLIQELDRKAIASYNARAFFRLGYQYYNFDYTGSSNWVGAPQKISELDDPMKQQLFAPVKNAQDLYATFEVRF
ncbi:DUF3373 domain-containing protein [bacterium]|nr:MAG: DUF3373 domain-containing protein [bacterium]